VARLNIILGKTSGAWTDDRLESVVSWRRRSVSTPKVNKNKKHGVNTVVVYPGRGRRLTNEVGYKNVPGIIFNGLIFYYKAVRFRRL